MTTLSAGFGKPFLLALLVLAGAAGTTMAGATDAIALRGDERGESLDSRYALWHDPGGRAGPDAAERVLEAGEFQPPALRVPGGSTGLLPGALWAHLRLHNGRDQPQRLQLEYVDHQLLSLAAWEQRDGGRVLIASLAMDAPFDTRPVPHQRFVVPLTIDAGATADLLLRYGSDAHGGYVFPDLRMWTPQALQRAQSLELAGTAFILGGLLLMAVVAGVVSAATRDGLFLAYGIYALSKIVVWCTVLGFTHEFLLRGEFSWRYMSVSGAASILAGTWFARLFLRSRRHIPRFDYLLRLMLGNAVVLLIAAVADLVTLAVLSITLALLLYPLVVVAALLRWRQGSREALVFACGWAVLVAALFLQALRDLGYLAHDFPNYYAPLVGSYLEMGVILVAMGLQLGRLRIEKQRAEQRLRAQLEDRQLELEALVQERTRELEAAKSAAELEAQTDPLTKTHNRRSFFRIAGQQLERSRHRAAPFALLMLDIDHFKAINDRHGHAAGDQALFRCAATMQHEIRDTDTLGRLGGEEFGILLQGPPAAVEQVAERLRSAVAAIVIGSESGEIRFTASIGLAHYAEDADLDALLERADRALYRAKEGGRDRVVVAGD